MPVITNDRAAGIRFVYHEYDYRPNWTTQKGIGFRKPLLVARNPNLSVAIEHARHVCRLMIARFLWTFTKNEWYELHAI